MCLSVVTKQYKRPNKTIIKGYKTLVMRAGRLLTSNQCFPVETGKWIEAGECDPPNSYEAGFHVFSSKKTARSWNLTEDRGSRVVEVKGRNVRVIGNQYGGRVYVCKEVFIGKRAFDKGESNIGILGGFYS